jgi:hypothetical protein
MTFAWLPHEDAKCPCLSIIARSCTTKQSRALRSRPLRHRSHRRAPSPSHPTRSSFGTGRTGAAPGGQRSNPTRAWPERFARRPLLSYARAALPAVLGLLVACATATTWRDIPVYPGATEVWRESRTGKVHVESRTYQVAGTTEAVVSFYRTRMAELDWEERAATRTDQGFLVRWWKQDGTQVQLQAFASEAGGVLVEITKYSGS